MHLLQMLLWRGLVRELFLSTSCSLQQLVAGQSLWIKRQTAATVAMTPSRMQLMALLRLHL